MSKYITRHVNENHMTLNPQECHYIVTDSKGPSSQIMVKKKKRNYYH